MCYPVTLFELWVNGLDVDVIMNEQCLNTSDTHVSFYMFKPHFVNLWKRLIQILQNKNVSYLHLMHIHYIYFFVIIFFIYFDVGIQAAIQSSKRTGNNYGKQIWVVIE